MYTGEKKVHIYKYIYKEPKNSQVYTDFINTKNVNSAS